MEIDAPGWRQRGGGGVRSGPGSIHVTEDGLSNFGED